ncbi:MAG: primosomal protein N' [Pyrinomonadaceae bacterium]|nr:primosomal protein N' [Pyrinomonadaceae bacterium]
MSKKPSAKSDSNTSAKPGFVEIALPVPLRQTFTYLVPETLQGEIRLGSRVIVPFGRRQLTGYAVAFHEHLPPNLDLDESSIKNVAESLDPEPLLTRKILDLTKWTADYYFSSWGEMLKASLPSGINARVDQIVQITPSGREEFARFDPDKKKPTRILILSYLAENEELAIRELKKTFGASKTQRAVYDLIKLGLITKHQVLAKNTARPKLRKAVRLISDKLPDSKGKALSDAHKRIIETLTSHDREMLFTDLSDKAGVGSSPINTLSKRGLLEIFKKEVSRDPFHGAELPKVKHFDLNDEQNSALTKITEAAANRKYRAFLLHGVTGSGKTEVYIRAMKKVLKTGRSSLMLVPEIALTPVFSKRLRAVFGKEVAILHSSLSRGERFDEWHRIRAGKAKIVIGTRSAVFAPLKKLGLVVVDEEHDTSYRQHEMPFYNGRDTAIVRAKFADAVVILGSATPALESFHNARSGKYDYLKLENRIGDRPLAQAKLIDMREVFEQHGKDLVFAPELMEAIEKTHDRNEQSLILLNRRGFSQFVLCRSCGESIRCPNCDITLTYHKHDKQLICHHCDHREREPGKCPSCESEFLFFLGQGTEKIENFLSSKFPDLRIARVDRDTTKKRKQLENTLAEFSRGEIDMLIGTQMLAKGHDFPNVTLVGVISVDTGLSMPDFRAAERTFQLLTQVAGRAGRGRLPGTVLIQTYYPEHYALKHAKTQDYDAFYDQEIMFREKYHFPPFVSLAAIFVKHPNYDYAMDNAKIYRAALDSTRDAKRCIILGPAPAALPRLKGEYRLQILIKARNRKVLRQVLDDASIEAEKNSCDLKVIFLEIDPVNML